MIERNVRINNVFFFAIKTKLTVSLYRRRSNLSYVCVLSLLEYVKYANRQIGWAKPWLAGDISKKDKWNVEWGHFWHTKLCTQICADTHPFRMQISSNIPKTVHYRTVCLQKSIQLVISVNCYTCISYMYLRKRSKLIWHSGYLWNLQLPNFLFQR